MMPELLSRCRARQGELVTFVRELVECESPSDDPAAVNRCNDLFAARIADIADVDTFSGGATYGRHLLCRFRLPGARVDEPQLLALGHMDTVWPLGTLAAMPFREAHDRLHGPGVLDMKTGLALFVLAMRVLRDLDVPVRRPVVLQVNADEEVGSPSSRALTEEQARRSAAVLVLEPGTGLTGKLKTARKGIGNYRITVQGQAAHAGVDFERGASAVLELAHQIVRLQGLIDAPSGRTVNVGVIQGGTRSNVVPAEAWAEVDVRVTDLADAEAVDAALRSLQPLDPRCRVSIEGGLNRPPMERTDGIGALFAQAQTLGEQIGLSLEESATGGGSDGNFTAALGIPTLDGLGAVGEGAHATHESVLIDRLADRAALLAGLVWELCGAGP